jgi:hypothetical protein
LAMDLSSSRGDGQPARQFEPAHDHAGIN